MPAKAGGGGSGFALPIETNNQPFPVGNTQFVPTGFKRPVLPVLREPECRNSLVQP